MMKTIISSLVLCVSAANIFAQGCSDAGLCTTPSFKQAYGMESAEGDNRLTLGFSFGAADYDISVFGGNLGYSRRLNERWSIDAEVTFLGQNGNDISVMGPGDIFLNLNHKFSEKFTFTSGVKFPLTKGNKIEDGKNLPMDYQSSLGTLDILAGIIYQLDHWEFALGFQFPLVQNENAFFPNQYDAESILSTIQATNMFERKSDVVLRITRPIEMSEKFTFTPGLLPIYHIAQDEYTDIDGIVQSIDGSNGVTLNGTLFMDYKIGDAGLLQLSIGFPFIVRDARPDGLTRSFVFGVAYAKSF